MAAKNWKKKKKKDYFSSPFICLRGLKFWALNLGLSHEENPTNLPISNYVEGPAILVIEQKTSSFSLGKDFVNISESL